MRLKGHRREKNISIRSHGHAASKLHFVWGWLVHKYTVFFNMQFQCSLYGVIIMISYPLIIEKYLRIFILHPVPRNYFLFVPGVYIWGCTHKKSISPITLQRKKTNKQKRDVVDLHSWIQTNCLYLPDALSPNTAWRMDKEKGEKSKNQLFIIAQFS